ncbi:Transcription factor Adf-1 [Papilio machaon]|uniref:Transcription factor Adf-1 n=1 Tax=Papilio machaon TaxID=76193 RepID=A0A0N1IBJ9_PAPMA|nr:Transcription factor Adf-1 [Papilio machaon]
MPLNAVGWTTEEDERLVELVEPQTCLYNYFDPSRKNILARECTWQEIATALSKPVEECKKRWRGLRDGFMRSKRLGTLHKTKANIFEKLQFLFEGAEIGEVPVKMDDEVKDDMLIETIVGPEQVITDNQEYYEVSEVTVVEDPQETQLKQNTYIKILPKMDQNSGEPPKKVKRGAGRKKNIPAPRNVPPVKILPKPLVVNGPKTYVRYVEDQKTPEQRSQVIDKLIEKVLKENTNEIDVFFRSMAASVKKLQPNLIPKVKMEVCNVIAKYEMQSFDKNLQNK